MLLRYGLNEESAAKRIEDAVVATLDRGLRTGDIFSTGMVSRSSCSNSFTMAFLLIN